MLYQAFLLLLLPQLALTRPVGLACNGYLNVHKASFPTCFQARLTASLLSPVPDPHQHLQRRQLSPGL